MKHWQALGIKFAVIATAVYSIYPLFDEAGFWHLLLLSILLTGASYAIGDLFLLKRYGNLVASIADFGLFFLVLWLTGLMISPDPFDVLTASFFTALFITFAEPFIHLFIQRRVLETVNEEYNDRTSYTGPHPDTEFSSDIFPEDVKKKRFQEKQTEEE
ncbi:uncharacterized protein DUF2512 [Melghiribacillus thermohalophilus]|uniref:Uncharacterized protein DUF2512 n=1 Tax=Melghiribacillus thermohalophilus TaxID=1324956 RepID=A0A4R3NBM3_9BACI|nr:YndM family protein [Melghiribacillus thermohalophilus]TCT24563.1 uncharacterized protein DUF2512 [Melghiribacillus thermohalophilus]